MGVGVAAGLGCASYIDYSDDYDINGSVGWKTYVGSAMIGGALGFSLGYYWPSITSFFGSSFSFTLPSFGALNMGGALVLAGDVTVTVTGAQIVGGAIATAGIGIMLFSKGFGPRMGHNQYEKQMWEEAKRLRNIKDKDLARRIHDKLKKYPYAETLDDLLNIIDDILSRLGKR